MSKHLLVTNDFPPKVGGIQNYLFELWRRLDPETYAILTAASHADALEFDAAQKKSGMQIFRTTSPLMYFPTPRTERVVSEHIASTGAGFVLFDPVVPLGILGPKIRRKMGIPYGVVLHGAEVTIPGRIPFSRQLVGSVIRSASLVVSAGGYPAKEGALAARRWGRSSTSLPPFVNIPPGVATDSFVPASAEMKKATRDVYGVDGTAPLVVSVSRLVPRKGMDVLIDACSSLAGKHRGLTLLIAGDGREMSRLKSLADKAECTVKMLGRVDEKEKIALLGAADVFAMACSNRWMGLEQEGFGIVFAEAASCGVPSVAGRSGGATEAVIDGETGIIVEHPENSATVAKALARLLYDPTLCHEMGEKARAHAVEYFDYGRLAPRLAAALEDGSK